MRHRGYTITTDPSQFDYDVIHAFLNNSYWSPGIPLHTLKKAIENSLSFAVLNADDETVGFARMITDRATFAYLADVFIIESMRGQGLSKWLMQTIQDHPDLQGLRRMVLITRDAHGLYEQYGFGPIAHPERMMEIVRPDIYLSKEPEL